MAIEDVQVGKLAIPVEFEVDKKALQGRFTREVEAEAKKIGKRQAEVQAKEFVAALEKQYQRHLGEAREELVRGLIDPKEFERRGQEAAKAMNKGILAELERRGNAGRLGGAYTDDFNALSGALKAVGGEGKKGAAGVGEMRESFASLLAQAAGVHPVLGRIVNVMGGMAMGSVFMGAVLAGLSALAWAWTKIRDEAKKAEEEQRNAIDRLRELRREEQLGPSGQTGADIKTAKSRQEEILAEQARIREASRSGSMLGSPAAVIAKLQAEYDDLEDLIQRAERKLGDTEAQEKRAAERRVAGVREEIRRQREAEQQKAQTEAERAAQKAQAAAGRLATLEGDMQRRLAALTATATDDLLLALDKLEADAREAAAQAGTAISQEFLDNLDLLRADAAGAQKLEGFQEQLAAIMRLDGGAMQQRALGGFVARLKNEAAGLKEGSKARKEYIDLIHRAEDAMERLTKATEKGTAATEKQADAEAQRRAQEELRNLRDRARLIEENAQAAIQLANAIGLVSDEASSSLQGLAQMGSALFRIFSGPTPDLSAIPSAIGGAAQALKGLFGGGGEAVQEARQRHEEQIDAMNRLVRALDEARGRVAGDLTEAQRTEFRSFLNNLTYREFVGGKIDPGERDTLERIARLLGADISSLVGSDGRLNNFDGIRALLQSLADLDIGVFGNDLEGRLDALNFVASELGDAAGTAADQLEKFLGVLASAEGGKASRFADSFRQVFDAEGAGAAQAFIRGLLERFGANDQTLFGTGGMFEGLTAEEVQRLLGESNGYLERLANGGAGSTNDFVQARSITEITAGRMEGALYTENVLSAERNALLRQLVGMQMSPSLVTGFGAGSVGPERVGVPLGGGGLTFSIDRIIDGGVQIHAGSGSTIDAAAVQAQVASVFESATAVMVEEVDRRLGQKYRNRQRTLGRS